MRSGTQSAVERERKFQTMATAWLFTHRSWNTQSAYETDLAQFAMWCANSGHTPLQADEDDVVRYRDECVDGGASPATVSRRLAALTSFYDHAVSVSDASENPASNVARPEPDSASSTWDLDAQDTAALLDAAEKSDPKIEALVGLLLLDGLKLGEVLAANIDDFSSDPPELRLPGRGRRQTVPLCAPTVAALQRSWGERTHGPLFLSDSPGRAQRTRLTRFGAGYLLKKVGARAGLTQPISANTLRRRYVTRAQSTGMALDEIQARVGHTDRRTTRRLLSVPTDSHP